MDDWLSQIGIHVADLFAGFCGGIVNAFVFKRSKPAAIVGSVVVGALTANFLGATFSTFLSHYVGASPGASSFIVGLAGMAICQGILDAAKSWRPFGSKGSSDVDQSRS